MSMYRSSPVDNVTHKSLIGVHDPDTIAHGEQHGRDRDGTWSAGHRSPTLLDRLAFARTTADAPRTVNHKKQLVFRRAMTVICVLPLLLILAWRTPDLLKSPLIVGYGFLVLSVTVALLYISFVHYEDPSEGPLTRRAPDLDQFPELPDNPLVSFLLAVKDDVDDIELCVRSITSGTYRNTELIVVDDGSTDGTSELLDRLAEELPVYVVHLDRNVGKKQALVRAAEHAAGDIIAFSDSDCFLAPDALERCVRALITHPELGAVSGHARASNADESFLTRAQDVWYEGQFRVAKAAEAVFGTVTCVSGPLAVFRREAILNYLPAWAGDRFLGGEFRFATDRQLTGYVLCQTWTGKRLKRKFATSPFVTDEDHPERLWRVGYVQSAKVWTTVPARVGPFMRQQVRWKKSFIRNLFFTGAYMWRRGPMPATLYYGHALWVSVAPIMAVRHLAWAPMHGLWFLTLLYLCGVMLKGVTWGLAFKLENRTSTRWRYRPVMSLISSLVLAWLLPYALLTIRRGVWARGAR
jgi:cellulose synthase/poly-beta-1,6-N-acetylglucosamine synthase-like glycosyltransferase